MKTLHVLLQSTQGMVFITIATAAFFFIIIGFFMGDGHDHDGDVGHDHDGGTDDGAHGFSTVSFFSLKVLSIFFLAFGAGGTIASGYGRGPVFSTVVGLVCGVIVGLIALNTMKILYGQQANSLITNKAIEGLTGQVVTRIPRDGVGEVTFVVEGQSTTRLAHSNGVELTSGKTVKIVSASGATLLVESVQ